MLRLNVVLGAVGMRRELNPLRSGRVRQPFGEWLFELGLILIVLGVLTGLCYGSYRFFGFLLGVW